MSIKSKISTVLFVAMTLGFPVTAFAQTPPINTANVAAECAKSAALCQAAVEAAIAELRRLGFVGAELNAQLGVLAGAALSGAKSLPAGELVALASTMSAISDASTDPAQKLALTQLSSDLSQGVAVDFTAVASAISSS